MSARSNPIMKRILEEQKVIEMLRQPEVIGIASGKVRGESVRLVFL